MTLWLHRKVLGHRTSTLLSWRPRFGGVPQHIVTCSCGRKVWLR